MIGRRVRGRVAALAALRRRSARSNASESPASIDNVDAQPQYSYGDKINELKDDTYLTCAFLNINGLPRHVNNPKEQMLHQLIRRYQFDAVAVSRNFVDNFGV